MKKLFALLLLAAVLAVPAAARLGDTLAAITKHRGKPAGMPDKNTALWLFEGGDEQLVYAVKFDAAGLSIAETLKPSRPGAKLLSEIVVDFIKAQREVLEGSKTTRELPVGAKYTFAGRALTVADNEYVVVDEPRGFLLVWARGSLPSITVIAPVTLK